MEIAQLEACMDQLAQRKEECMKKGDLKQVQNLMLKIEELQAVILIYQSIQSVEEQEVEMLSLEITAKKQLEEFDQAWEDLYRIEQDRVKEAEQTIYELHYKEMEQLRQALLNNPIPKVKYSPEVLQRQGHYNQLIKGQQYAQAENLRKQLEEMMTFEQSRWDRLQNEKIENKLNLLTKKQINELQALKQKLQSQIQAFIVNRDNQRHLLLQKQQIQRSELETKYNSDCVRYNQQNNKLLHKLNVL